MSGGVAELDPGRSAGCTIASPPDRRAERMRWIAPSAKTPPPPPWKSASGRALTSSAPTAGSRPRSTRQPVLGLIFLRFADARFAARRADARARPATGRRGSRVDDPAAYHAEGVLFLPAEARFDDLLEFPGGRAQEQSIGQAVNDAMRDIEKRQPAARGRAAQDLPALQRHAAQGPAEEVLEIPLDLDGDSFGRIYEYFLGEFAMTEGPGRRRVLHADQHRPLDGRDPRAVPRAHPRSGVRLGRHVRAERALRRRAPEEPGSASSPSTASRRPTTPAASAA